MWVDFKELWDPAHYRSDDIWGRKRKACLFRSTREHVFDDRRLHAFWASVPQPEGGWPLAEARIYHLRMIDPADRVARAQRYERLDPDHVWQTIGYDYLLDDSGLELTAVEPDRGYLTPGGGAAGAAGPAEAAAHAEPLAAQQRLDAVQEALERVRSSQNARLIAPCAGS